MPTSAQLGFVGYVRIADIDRVVRATSCDIRMSQSIEKPTIVDGKFDKTVYQLGPREVGGTLAFPAVYEDGSAVTEYLWKAAIQRNISQGRLTNRINDLIVKYSSGSIYSYTDCLIDTFEFSVAQSDVVNVSCGIFGIDRGYPSQTASDVAKDFYNLNNTRIVTWNDAVVRFLVNTGGNSTVVSGSEIRNFTATVNNNSQRYYTLNSRLTAQDIAATKRDITGNMTVMGRNNALANAAAGDGVGNEFRCTELSQIDFGYCVGNKSNLNSTGDISCNASSNLGCNGNFLVHMEGVVFEIEEIAIGNELLETTVNYHVLPGIPIGSDGPTYDFLN